MKAFLFRFCSDERGATAIEYALIASVVSIAIAGTLYEIGPRVTANFQATADAFNQ